MRLEIVVPAGAFISANGRLRWAEKNRRDRVAELSEGRR